MDLRIANVSPNRHVASALQLFKFAWSTSSLSQAAITDRTIDPGLATRFPHVNFVHCDLEWCEVELNDTAWRSFELGPAPTRPVWGNIRTADWSCRRLRFI